MPEAQQLGWAVLLLTLCSACASPPAPQKRVLPQVVAPEQPSAELLEFVGDWSESEREMLNAEPIPPSHDRRKAR